MLVGSAMSITLVTVGAAALINLWLGARTGAVRIASKVDIGDGGNALLLRRMRAHANFVEYAPFILLLVAVIEFTTGSSVWLWAASALFLVARVLHPLGMDGLKGARQFGTFVTFTLLLVLGGYAVSLPLLSPHVAASTPAVGAVPAG